ncbi:MAG: hypothetical protein JST00_40375 [Deltaproteobacteria bacterium]|nr:hypothetical protein [Deltaproteobacteria bacterium]
MADYLISDGASFSVDLGGAHICFIEPKELRTPNDCVAVDLSVYKAPQVKPGVTHLANGILRSPTNAEDPVFLGSVVVMKLALKTEEAPDQAAADRFAMGLIDTGSSAPPAGVKFLPPKAWIVKNGDTTLVRATVDVEGLAPEDSSAHREVLVAFGRDDAYSTSWTSRRADASVVKGYADAAALATKLAPEVQPRRPLDMRIVGGVVALLVVVMFVLGGRKKKGPASGGAPPPDDAKSV